MFRLDLWNRKRPRDRAGTVDAAAATALGEGGGDASDLAATLAFSFDDDARSVPEPLKTSSCSLTAPTVSTADGRQQQQQLRSLPPATPAAARRSRTLATLGRGRSLLFPRNGGLRTRRREKLECKEAKARMASTRIHAQDDCVETRWHGCGQQHQQQQDEMDDCGGGGCFAPSNPHDPANNNLRVLPHLRALEVEDVREDFPENWCCDPEEDDHQQVEDDWEMEDAILFVNNEFTVLEFTADEFGDNNDVPDLQRKGKNPPWKQ